MIELAPPAKHRMTYEDAILYCQFLEHNGHRDWRLPTAEENEQFAVNNGWYIGRKQMRYVIDGSYVMQWVYPVRNND